MRWQAVIFDMDGTLLETERLVIEAGLTAMTAHGLPKRRDVLEQLVGTVADESMFLLRAAFGPEFDQTAFEATWECEFSTLLESGIPLRPGVRDLLAHLDAIVMPRALATNSRTSAARVHLARAGIAAHFPARHIHGRDQVARPKPAPDLFLLAAQTLGVSPADCLVFEDSDPGAEAAVAAGMTVVLVPDQRKPRFNHAHHVAPSLLDGARAAGLME